ncbi:MAG: vitamin B12-dependent ribonucleotide reductase [Oscillospiraceae bacterium]
MEINNNGLTVLEKRYLLKDDKGNIVETVPQMFKRVATAIAEMDEKFDSNCDIGTTAKIFYDMMSNLDFLPNSPTLMNAGRQLGQLSACFVLPVEDSMEDIFEAVKQAALIHKSGGGTGFSFSRLRPRGSTVCTTGGVASGPISFMRVFNMATEAVKQGGTRRGANMGILRIDHPDILEFIDCKKDNSDITNFNISVGVTENFMEAVKNGSTYDLIDPSTKNVVKSLDALEVFNKIVDGAWKNGEPGIIFLDRLNQDNVVPSQGLIESTNPCGEQPLLPFESCNLGSINLVNMLKKSDDIYSIDWSKLRNTVINAVHFLDNVIEANRYPIKQIDITTKKTRKIGLGIMGYADMLLCLHIPYNSKAGIETAEEIMNFINRVSHEATIELARSRGAFPLFEESIFASSAKRRNATTTTIAPTGTLSIIAGCSSGVEPVFAYVFIRNIMDGTHLVEVNPILKTVLTQRGLYSDELINKIAQEGTLAHLDEIPQDIKDVFVCSHDISPEYHVKMQSAFQKYTDNAVSKTVNFSHDATKEQVSNVFMLAYETNCKGITIYRDGSRDGQVLNIGNINETAASTVNYPSNILPRPRPEVMKGVTERMKIGCGNLYVTVNYDDKGICEVFTSTGKAGGCPSQSEATARLASIALRSGISLDEVLSQLKGIRCPSTIRQQNMKCSSCPDAIARVVRKVADMIEAEKKGEHIFSDVNDFVFCPKCGAKLSVKNDTMVCENCNYSIANIAPQPVKSNLSEQSEARCPECNHLTQHEGGCVICRNCGYSKCN